MSEPFIGEIKMFGGNFAILGYAFCDGTLMSIDQNDALFNLIGTTYGGDGLATFALPDLRGRIPVHQGSGFQLGQLSGTETVTLTTAEIASHNHAVAANSNTGSSGNPQGNIVAGSTVTPYNTAAVGNNMGGSSIGKTGGSQPHDNIMPYQCVNYIIALEGIFPSRN